MAPVKTRIWESHGCRIDYDGTGQICTTLIHNELPMSEWTTEYLEHMQQAIDACSKRAGPFTLYFDASQLSPRDVDVVCIMRFVEMLKENASVFRNKLRATGILLPLTGDWLLRILKPLLQMYRPVKTVGIFCDEAQIQTFWGSELSGPARVVCEMPSESLGEQSS